MLDDVKHGMESKVFSRFRVGFERKSQCRDSRGKYCSNMTQGTERPTL